MTLQLPTPAAGLDRPAATGREFRTDIAGLRAVAVVLVVAYHAGMPGFSGGFVGVDVFFVLSGYLITALLLDELAETGRVDLRGFFARRARRLLPAAVLASTTTVVVSALVLAPSQIRRTAGTQLASLLHLTNEHLARRPDGYFAPAAEDDPLLHYWSLATEEQFYLVWPLLLASSWAVCRRRRRPVRAMAGGLAALGVAGLVLSELLLRSDPTAAYYTASSRAWEFLAGGAAVAAARATGFHPRPPIARLLAGAGLVLLALTALRAPHPFPASGALAPVLATTAVLVARLDPTDPIGRALAWRPLQELGRLSYGWYLWHWPFLVIPRLVVGELDATARGAAVGASLLAAEVSYRLVEDPLRRHPALRRPGRTWLLAAALLVIGLAASWGAHLRADRLEARPGADAVLASETDWTPGITNECSTLQAALSDGCVWGDPDGSTSVLLLGDSHAEQWLPVLDDLGRRHGVRVVARTVSGCSPLPTGVGTGRDPVACRRSQDELGDLLASVAPDLVVASNAGSPIDAIGRDRWVEGGRRFAAALADAGAGLVWVADTPVLDRDPQDCLLRRGVDGCRPAADEALVFHRLQQQLVAVWLPPGATVVDPIPALCDDETCPLVVDGIHVYLDRDHLTASGARLAGAGLEGAVVEAVG